MRTICAVFAACILWVGVAGAVPPTTDFFGGDLYNRSDSILIDYTGTDTVGSPTGDDGERQNISTGAYYFRIVANKAIDYMKRLLTPIAIATLFFGGLLLFWSRGDDQVMEERKKQLAGTALGLGTIIIAYTFVDRMFFGVRGQIFADADSSTFGQEFIMQAEGIFDFLATFAIPIAVLYVLYTSFQLIFGGENEEELTGLKKRITWTLLGMAVLVSWKYIVPSVFVLYGDSFAMPSTQSLVGIAFFWTNILLTFVATLAVVAFVWAGIRMVASFGDDEGFNAAKKTMIYAVIGLVLAFSGFVLIRYVGLSVAGG